MLHFGLENESEKKTFSIADDDDGNVNEDESNIKNVYNNFYIYKKMNKRKSYRGKIWVEKKDEYGEGKQKFFFLAIKAKRSKKQSVELNTSCMNFSKK